MIPASHIWLSQRQRPNIWRTRFRKDEVILADKPEGSQTAEAAERRSRPSILRLMLQPSTVRSALKVSLVVGTVLNIINNGEQVWTSHTITLWRLALNFAVPYCVSSYSAARNQAQHSGQD